MQLTDFTDYSLRVLIFVGLKGGQSTVAEIATAFRISRHHLVKVVHRLGTQGFLKSSTGKTGGIQLACNPAEVRLGDFVRKVETNLALVECFQAESNTCPIAGCCKLEGLLHQARDAFLESLNRSTLADLLAPGPGRDERMRRLGLSPQAG